MTGLISNGCSFILSRRKQGFESLGSTNELNNYRLAAGRFVILEILKYRLVRDVAAGCAEVASRPKVAPPVPLAKLWELHLHPLRGTAFDPAHKIANRDMRRYFELWPKVGDGVMR
jgi:hypothetical protein